LEKDLLTSADTCFDGVEHFSEILGQNGAKRHIQIRDELLKRKIYPDNAI